MGIWRYVGLRERSSQRYCTAVCGNAIEPGLLASQSVDFGAVFIRNVLLHPLLRRWLGADCVCGVRCVQVGVDPKNTTLAFAQVTVRVQSRQKFAAYDRKGHLLAGSPDQEVRTIAARHPPSLVANLVPLCSERPGGKAKPCQIEHVILLPSISGLVVLSPSRPLRCRRAVV